jgi:hypothetical protein
LAVQLPPPPPGADPEAALFVSSICAAAHLGKLVGCRSHPPFDRPEQQPDGTFPEYVGDPLSFCALTRIYRGSFTRPHAEQAVLGFEQCQRGDDTWDMSQPGSAVLVERLEGRWRAVATQQDVNLEFCVQPRRADGRDLLFCWSNLTAAPPVGTIRYWFSLDFARPSRFATTHVRVYSDSELCSGIYDPTSLRDHGFIVVRVLSTKLTQDSGQPRIELRLARARIAPQAGLEAKAREACQHDPNANEKSLGREAEEVKLELELADDGIVPLPTTRETLSRFTAESPENFYGLVQICPPDAP